MTKPVIYITGVSGSGKTTIGETLSAQTHIPFFDADHFHPPANIEKMKAGIPLNDEDRKGWLQQLHTLALQQQQTHGAIIACSALKERYRTILAEAIQQPVWIFLKGDYDTILQRLNHRKGHYMPPSLLQSQFDDLEIPQHAITADIKQTPEQIVTDLLTQLHLH